MPISIKYKYKLDNWEAVSFNWPIIFCGYLITWLMLSKCQIKQEKKIGVWWFNENCPPENCLPLPRKLPPVKIAPYWNTHLWKYPIWNFPSLNVPSPPLKLHPRKVPPRKLSSRELSPMKVLTHSWLLPAPINNNKINLLIKIESCYHMVHV